MIDKQEVAVLQEVDELVELFRSLNEQAKQSEERRGVMFLPPLEPVVRMQQICQHLQLWHPPDQETRHTVVAKLEGLLELSTPCWVFSNPRQEIHEIVFIILRKELQ